MTIDLRGLPIDEALRERVNQRLTAVLGRLAIEPTVVHVIFSDEDGPKGGPAIRCAVTATLPRRSPLHVEETAETPRSAFDRVAAMLERQLAKNRDRTREGKRRPKKYFAARRLLEGPIERGPNATSPAEGGPATP